MTESLVYLIKSIWEGRDARRAADDLDKVGKAGDDASRGLKESQRGMDGMSGSIKNLLAGGLLASAGSQLIEMANFAIEAASDVQEAENKFNVVFSQTAPQVRSELDEFAATVGRNKFELREYASTLGDTLKPMGLSEQAAADFSVQLVKLGTDLSSFNNIPMDEALRRLQGTLIGSHENALAFGVVINENTLKAELARQGWDNLTGAQLEQAKVQARINLLMAGTTDAQGDATRSADDYANVSRSLESATAELAAEIGENLLPAMTALKESSADVVRGLTDTVSTNNNLRQAVEDGIITLEEMHILQQQMRTRTDGLSEAQALLAKRYAETETGLAKYQPIAEESVQTHTELADEVGALANEFIGLSPEIQKNYEFMQIGSQAGKDYSDSLTLARDSMAGLNDTLPTNITSLAQHHINLQLASAGLGTFKDDLIAANNEAGIGTGLIASINRELGILGTQRKFSLDIGVTGLEKLKEAVAAAAGFNSNDAPDPFSPTGDLPANPFDNITGEGVDSAIPVAPFPPPSTNAGAANNVRGASVGQIVINFDSGGMPYSPEMAQRIAGDIATELGRA